MNDASARVCGNGDSSNWRMSEHEGYRLGIGERLTMRAKCVFRLTSCNCAPGGMHDARMSFSENISASSSFFQSGRRRIKDDA